MSDEEQNGMDDFRERFSALADEAQKYGVFACVVLQTDDPIAGKSHLAEIYRGGRMRTIGMMQQAMWHLQQSG